MNFLDLNDDVLDAIVSYLSAEDALYLSSTCRRVHDIGARKALARVSILNNNGRFMSFGACVLSKISDRSTYLRELHVSLIDTSREGEFDSASLILARVLRRSQNLRILVLRLTEILIENAPVVARAVGDMNNLVVLELHHAGCDSIKMLSKVRSRLDKLVVRCPSSFTISNRRLLPHIGHIRSLRSLEINGMRFEEKLHPQLIWKGMRTLRLESCKAPMTLIVHSFPNLRTIHLDGILRWHEMPNVDHCWPSLDELTAESAEDLIGWPITCPVRSVSYRALINTTHDSEITFSQIRRMKPIALSLTMKDALTNCWAELVQDRQRLRSLSLCLVEREGFANLDANFNMPIWMEYVLPVLKRLKIIFLRICVYGLYHPEPTIAETFPDEIVQSLPSLRCLAFGVDPSIMRWWQIITKDNGERERRPISPAVGIRVKNYLSSEVFETSMAFDESPRDLNQWRISSPVISLVYHSAIYADEIEYACIGIRNTNPIVLSLTITETFVEVWTDVIEGNPRLRVLHLDFFGLRALWMWIDVILPVLEKSHLILIRVRIIEAFPAQEREEVQTDADKYSSWISWSIPSLQYLAFEIGSSECGLVESKRHVFWWRITTGDGGRFPTPISKEIGERIEDYTTSVAFESSMTIDDAFFA
ncbi:uncharacterized protein FIBRA_02556 [Fibroporia radiculosa]|uniref:F-box domain-containing protein n=1 Tax=Fibroporia radiculosa TaxID=599839 RepID=J4HV47_9APHY|nr:uncharacterized protein FIBRA_02556 [Fibroporia radiculosa]CCM00522.1 predicted protein [Fibroporia radiculosa]